jgi:hypothetical protein
MKEKITFVPIRSYIIFALYIVLYAFQKIFRLDDSLYILVIFGLVFSIYKSFFWYSLLKNDHRIIKYFIGIELYNYKIDEIEKVRLYKYMNRRSWLEENQEIRSDRYYRFDVWNKAKRYKIYSQYRTKEGLAIMDVIPNSYFRKAELKERINLMR